MHTPSTCHQTLRLKLSLAIPVFFLTFSYHYRHKILHRLNLVLLKTIPKFLTCSGHFLKTFSKLYSHLLITNDRHKWAKTRKSTNYAISSPNASLLPAIASSAIPAPPSLTLSFSGCSWNLFYHLGVTACFLSTFPTTNFNAYGSSCGSLIALTICDKISLNDLRTFCYDMLSNVKSG